MKFAKPKKINFEIKIHHLKFDKNVICFCFVICVSDNLLFIIHHSLEHENENYLEEPINNKLSAMKPFFSWNHNMGWLMLNLALFFACVVLVIMNEINTFFALFVFWHFDIDSQKYYFIESKNVIPTILDYFKNLWTKLWKL